MAFGEAGKSQWVTDASTRDPDSRKQPERWKSDELRATLLLLERWKGSELGNYLIRCIQML
jgi:hypothetical protein